MGARWVLPPARVGWVSSAWKLVVLRQAAVVTHGGGGVVVEDVGAEAAPVVGEVDVEGVFSFILLTGGGVGFAAGEHGGDADFDAGSEAGGALVERADAVGESLTNLFVGWSDLGIAEVVGSEKDVDDVERAAGGDVGALAGDDSLHGPDGGGADEAEVEGGIVAGGDRRRGVCGRDPTVGVGRAETVGNGVAGHHDVIGFGAGVDGNAGVSAGLA